MLSTVVVRLIFPVHSMSTITSVTAQCNVTLPIDNTAAKYYNITDTPICIDRRNSYETMYGRKQSAPQVKENNRAGAGDRPYDRRGRSLRGYPVPDKRRQISAERVRKGRA